MKVDGKFMMMGGLLLFLVLAVAGCGGREGDNRDVADEEVFSIVGTWELNEIRFLTGQRVDVHTGYEYVWYRFFEEDGTYYVAELNAGGVGKKPLKPHEMSEYFFMMSPYDTVFIEHGRMRGLIIMDNRTMGIDRGDYVEVYMRNDELPANVVSEIEGEVEAALRPNRGGDTQYIMPASSANDDNKGWIWIVVLVVVLLAGALYLLYKEKNKDKQPETERDVVEMEEDEQENHAFIHSDYYLTLRRRLCEEPPLKPDEWKELESQMRRAYPRFFRKLAGMCQLSEVELRVIMLIKLGIPPSAIAIHTCREYSSISSIRSRLYYKLFGKKGGAKDLDDFIINL